MVREPPAATGGAASGALGSRRGPRCVYGPKRTVVGMTSTPDTPDEPQELRAHAHEAAQLARGRCPWSGLYLRVEEWASTGRRMVCGVCDCFGWPA